MLKYATHKHKVKDRLDPIYSVDYTDSVRNSVAILCRPIVSFPADKN